MDQIIQAIKELYAQCQAKIAELNAKLAQVQEREKAVKAREEAATRFESAEAAFAAADAQRRKNDAERAAIAEERIKLDNWAREERQAIKNEYGRLSSLQDQEKQLFRDKQALYDAQAALEVEKKSYRERIKAELKEHFRNTNGKGE